MNLAIVQIILFLTSLHLSLAYKLHAETFVSSRRSTKLSAKVALTREQGSNDQIRALLELKNIDCVEIPCIAFAPGKDISLLASEVQKCDLVVLSSPQAASVFLEYWIQCGKPEIKVATVGKGSSKPLLQAGIKPLFEPSDSTAAAFAAELPIELGPNILYPTSSIAENTMQQGLEDRGFKVKRLNTYETIEASWSAENLADAKSADIVAFASPSAVRTWQSRCGTNFVAVTIGPTSAKAAAQFKEVISPEGSKGIEAWANIIIKAVDEFDSGVC
jgi:uroporphyrinogen-III synthase